MMTRLEDIALINPRLEKSLDAASPVSFVPMASLSAEEAKVISTTEKTYAEVAKGYTPFQSGDVLVAKITPCFENGKIAQALLPHEHGFGSTEFHVIRPKGATLDARYLHHFLRLERIRIEGERRMTGSGGQRRVPANFLAGLEILLPSIKEQHRIAAILDQADALRAKRREALSQLDRLAQSVFIEMFGDPVKNTKGWPLRSFNDACPTRLGKMLDQKQQTGQHSRKYLRNANVQWFRFDLGDVLEMDFDEAARETFSLKEGDLLICEGGEPGRAAIWRNQLVECYYQKALHRGRPEPTMAQPEYLLWLLWFLSKHGGLSDHVTSATIAHLTGEKLKAMMIPLPPLTLQRKFAERLKTHEQLRLTLEHAVATQDALFASLQHRAFRGEL